MALSLSRGGVRVPEGGEANVRSRIRGHLNISRASGSARGGARGREVGGRVTHCIRPRLQGRRQRGAGEQQAAKSSISPAHTPLGRLYGKHLSYNNSTTDYGWRSSMATV